MVVAKKPSNREGAKGRWLRKTLLPLPTGQSVDLYWLANDFGKACFNGDCTRAENYITWHYCGPLPQAREFAWTWQPDRVLAKLARDGTMVLIWIDRLALGAMLAES